MLISELLNKIQALYLIDFRKIIEEYTSDNLDLIIEPELLDKEGVVKTGGFLDTPIRLDILVVDDGIAKKEIRVDSSKIINFQPITLQWSPTLTVTLYPFQWDYTKITINVKSEPDWQILRQWFFTAFTTTIESDYDFLGVVHCITDPVFENDTIQFYIDFGSASIDVIEDLFDVFDRMGVYHLSFSEEKHN